MKHLWLIGLMIVADQSLKWYLVTNGQTVYRGSVLSIPIAIIIIAWALIFSKSHANIGLSLIIAGGISNIIDLVIFQHIRDIMMVKNAAFNLADVAIITGAALIVSQNIKKHEPVTDDD